MAKLGQVGIRTHPECHDLLTCTRKAMCWQLVEPKNEDKPRVKLQEHVLLIRRVFDKEMNPTRTEIDVNGAILRRTLINMFRDAPGFPLTMKKRTLDAQWFFWARHDLSNVAKHCKAIDDTESLFEIEAALLLTAEYHGTLLAELGQPSETSGIAYNDLWCIYAPGTLIYGRDFLEQDRVWRVTKAEAHMKQDGGREFKIDAESAESDGKKLGLVVSNLIIAAYDGSVPIESLAYKPLHMMPQREQIWRDLLARAERQLAFLSTPYKIQDHEGEAIVYGHANTPEWEQKDPQRYHFKGRIMVDPIQYRAAEQAPLVPTINKLREIANPGISTDSVDGGKPRTALDLLPDPSVLEAEILSTPVYEELGYDPFANLNLFPPPPIPVPSPPGQVLNTHRGNTQEDLKKTIDKLIDVDKLLFSGLVYGFSLSDMRWAAFAVSRVTDVQWRKDMLSSLVISAPVLTSMRQLIQSHSCRSSFDDFVPGKGQGLIGLFSGQPGLGKTFTAEAIAETAEKPLYSVSSGTLGSSASDINMKLRKIMNLCAHWQAVLLLDEADVFLAKRNMYDLERNAIVSVFLRELEYYPGIMILTTNQPEIIDPAFQSRIHFCYRYPSLDWRARRQVWLQFIEKAEASLGAARVDVDGAGLSELTDLEYNGRQIKNAVSIAITLAGGKEGRVLSTESILEVTRTLQAFDFSAPGMESDSDI
ncbi:Putative AAA+ ATPase domain, ATPase, AAA-type, core [Septoria linicola]|uniref:AAA+ ATPase domain, ATPase, AAA-type, core n=1 Tax=Septoria linicola TaxID=215465 RepID=A0A9Q9B0Y2_9PEZI|nr:putative AAA+ ATPase domain, ATPase, AAA-type, core [Septoria linicola]USW58954.1 Putative AAA+ ATPase domain, ATPase, AAA-type, core [Septoria linicola]